jgi:hypothetical protein
MGFQKKEKQLRFINIIETEVLFTGCWIGKDAEKVL